MIGFVKSVSFAAWECLHQNQIHAEAEKTDEKPQVPLFRTKKKHGAMKQLENT